MMAKRVMLNQHFVMHVVPPLILKGGGGRGTHALSGQSSSLKFVASNYFRQANPKIVDLDLLVYCILFHVVT
jgi:hypothetical protein